MAVRIALIHSVLPAINAVEKMFEKHWPEAQLASIYDQSLYIDLNPDRTMPEKVVERIDKLVKHCRDASADAILCTGSLFGPAVEAAREGISIPILTSFEALIETAFKTGNNFTLIATDPGTNKMLQRDMQLYANKEKQTLQTEAIFVDQAMSLLSSGDQQGHDELVMNAALQAQKCDAILLGQFSMGPTKPLIEAKINLPVLDAPETAVIKLKNFFTDQTE